MDIMCSKCMEPWELSHALEVKSWGDAEELEDWVFNGKQIMACPCCKHQEMPPQFSPEQEELKQASDMLHDLLGDDVDGIASELEDFKLLMRRGPQ